MDEDIVDPPELLIEVADELGLSHDRIPTVRRTSVPIEGRGDLSALRWGEDDPELVFLHGGGQNAHTWDLVAMQLSVPAVAVDLPGHGHSYRREDRNYWPPENAVAVATVIEQLAPSARGVIGMSLGGLTAIRLAATRPDLVPRAVVVDVTPGVMAHHATRTQQQRGTTALIQGPRTYASRDDMIAEAVRASPRRPASATRRGVIHNSRKLPDGTWTWRYDLGDRAEDFTTLWNDVDAISAPIMLVRGRESVFVPMSDAVEFARRQPGARLEVVAGAGHSVQSDQPIALAGLIADFVYG